MRFYVGGYPDKSPPADAAFPCAVLIPDSWDDFGYKTLFGLQLYRTRGNRIFEGSIKILQRDPSDPTQAVAHTTLPPKFEALGEDLCSLGQTWEFYEALKAAGANIYVPFLVGLRDAAYDPEIGAGFSMMEGFRKSLLRFSEAEKAFREAVSLFDGSTADQLFAFRFRCTVENATEAHDVEFDFSPHPTELHRTTVLVGKNGTGKTQFLARFALAMSGISADPADDSRFSPRRPSFSRVIAVSYSAFDDFRRPREGVKTFSYKYCGIRTPESAEEDAVGISGDLSRDSRHARLLSSAELTVRIRKAREEIRELGRDSQWKEIIAILLEDAFELPDNELSTLAFYNRLSSGQRILVATLTEIVAYITKDSVVLFDEPELHLHPEVFAALARAIDRLLHRFDSYAIIATHSPLLLQETLARQVRIFRRQGTTPVVMPLTIESFGENLSVITSEVFAVDGAKYNFRAHLDELMETRSADEVERLFPGGLPMQALAYMKARSQPGQE